MLSIHNSQFNRILPSNNSIHLHQFVYPNYHMSIQIVTSRHAESWVFQTTDLIAICYLFWTLDISIRLSSAGLLSCQGDH